jgi:hypothetical protein
MKVKIEFETRELAKYLMTVLFIIFCLTIGAYMSYHIGKEAGVASVPVPTATPVPTPIPAPATLVPAAPAMPVPVIAYISDVSSIGTDFGYVCLVDQYGREYLIMNFDPGTAELLHASYSGTVVNTYNGIPMLENVALTAYQPVDYYQNRQYYYRQDDEQNNYKRYYTRYDGQTVKCAGTMICG